MARIELTATGSNDHTALTNAIAAASAGDTIALLAGSTAFSWGGTVTVNKQLTIEVNGTILTVPTHAAAPALLFTANGSGLTGTGVIDGNSANAVNENQGVAFQKMDSPVLSGSVTIKNFRGHQIMFYGVKGAPSTLTGLTTRKEENTSTGTSHGMDIDTSNYTVTGASWAANVATVTIGAGHSLIAGDYVTVTNIVSSGPGSFNGAFQLTAANSGAGTVSYALASDPGTYTSGGGLGRNTTDLIFEDCDLDNGYQSGGRQSMKAESCNGVKFRRTRFRSEVALGDNVTTSNCGATLEDDCVLDAVCKVFLRTSTFSPTIQDTELTRDGGCILIYSMAGAPLVLKDNRVYGRNYYLGYNGTTWTAVSNVTETGTYHPGKDSRSGKTMFASYTSTGAAWHTIPFVTPNTACNNYEDLVENAFASLHETGMHYALLSDRGAIVLPSNESTIGLPANIQVVLEGYPGVADINVGATTADWCNFVDQGSGSILRRFKFHGGRGSGQSAMVIQGANWTIEDVEVYDYVGTATGTALDCRGTASNTANVTLRRCNFHDISGTATAQVINVQTVTNVATVTTEGCKVHDCTTTGTGIIRNQSAGSTINLHGTEIARCTATGVGVVYNQGLASINACTFANNNNTSASNDDLTTTTAITIKSSIFESNADLGGAGVKTMVNCLIGDGLGSLTDGGGNITGSPTYVNSAGDNYNLAAGSLGIGTGTLWWTAANARPQGANGEPFPDLKIDIGANQSTHDAMHPANL